MTHPTHASLRKALREASIRTREDMPAITRAQWTHQIEAHLDRLMDTLAPRCLGFCWPHRGEADLREWVARWLTAAPGRSATLPVVKEKATPMAFHFWLPESPMTLDRHGIPIPATPQNGTPEVLLIPLNVFDDKGYRLGYGGGYFDRTLEALDPAPIKVGIGFELSRAPTTHPQAHDHPMDWIVTEAGAWGPLQAPSQK